MLPGVQIVYAGAFHVPAQANPLGAISSTPAGLFGVMENVNAGRMPVFELFCALAVNPKVVPTCKE
jgi:hypothetical protein